MSFTENPGLVRNQWLYNGKTLEELAREELVVQTEFLAKRKAFNLTAQQHTEAVNILNAERAAADNLSEHERRHLLRDAIFSYVNASVAANQTRHVADRAATAVQEADSRRDSYNDVGRRITEWGAEQIKQGLPTTPLPSELARQAEQHTEATKHAAYLADALQRLRAEAAEADAIFQRADALRIELARRLIALQADSLAEEIDRTFDRLDRLRQLQVTFLDSFIGGSQLPISFTARSVLDRSLAEPVIDHVAQAAIQSWHQQLLDDADAELPKPEHTLQWKITADATVIRAPENEWLDD